MRVRCRYKEIESSRRVRLAELLQQEEEDLQRDCTFKPQINPHPSHQHRGDFLAEAQLRERKKRLQQLLAVENDSTDDEVVRSLRSAISSASRGSPAVSKPAHRSPAATPQFSPAFSLAASIVGANGIEGSSSSSSVAAHGRHEDPDVRGGVDAHAGAAAGAVEKVCVFFGAKYCADVPMLPVVQVLVAPPAELPESDDAPTDDDARNDGHNSDRDSLYPRQEQQRRRGAVRGSTANAAAAAADGYSAVRLSARLQHENDANQPSSSSHSVRTPKFVYPRPSIAASIGSAASATPSLRQHTTRPGALRPASAPARARPEASDSTSGATDGGATRARALPSRVAAATAIAAAAARQVAEESAEGDQQRKKQQESSSFKRTSTPLSHNSSNVNKNLPSLLYKDAEFRALRRQLLGVQQELIMEQSSTP